MSGNKTDNGVLEVGTDEIRVSYSEDTPGQYVDAFIKEQEKAFHEQQKKVKKNFSTVFQNPLKGFPYNEEIIVTPLHEGTWALPKTSKEKKLLKDLMKKPIPLGKDGDPASRAIVSLIGDDSLLDDLYTFGKKNPKADARPIIRKAMKRLGIKEEVSEAFSKKQARGKDIAKKMMKSKTMGAFAKKVAKMSKVTASDLDKMLPDYVSGGDIGKLFEGSSILAKDIQRAKRITDIEIRFNDEKEWKRMSDLVKKELRKPAYKGLPKPYFSPDPLQFGFGHAEEKGAIKLNIDIKPIVDMIVKLTKDPQTRIKSMNEHHKSKDKPHAHDIDEGYNNPSFEEFQEASRKMSGSKLTGAEISSYFRRHKVKDKTVRKAVEIALDHGGAMNYAIKQIEKLKRGLSNHKDVEKALEVANFGEHVSEEDVEKFFGFFSEAFTDAQIDKLRKSYATVKGIDPTTGTGKKLLDFMRGRAEDELVALYKGKINFISLLAASNLIARFKYSSADILKLKEEKLKEAPVLPSTQAGQIQGDHSVEDGVKKYEDVINKQIQTGRFSKLHKERQTKIIARKANKYYRVEEHEMGRAGSIHAFIDISNGDIFKPASFKAPAKGARGNVTDQRYIDYVAKYPDSYYGGHLYK